jgi:hypothetical protein
VIINGSDDPAGEPPKFAGTGAIKDSEDEAAYKIRRAAFPLSPTAVCRFSLN